MATLSSIITPTNVLTASSTATLTNKTISGASNTITNVPLGTAVTGTLPIANGGTGTTSTTFANLTTNVTGTLPVANGGTGAATLTANNVLLGNGTSAVQVVAPGSSGNVLTSNGTTWTSAAASTGALVLLSTTNASSVSAVNITGISSTYDFYYVMCSNLIMSGSGDNIYVRVLDSGGTPYASSYSYTGSYSSSANINYSAGVSFFRLITDSISTSYRSSFILTVVNQISNNGIGLYSQSAYSYGSYQGGQQMIGGCVLSDITGVRIYAPGATNFNGDFRLYGFKKT